MVGSFLTFSSQIKYHFPRAAYLITPIPNSHSFCLTCWFALLQGWRILSRILSDLVYAFVHLFTICFTQVDWKPHEIKDPTVLVACIPSVFSAKCWRLSEWMYSCSHSFHCLDKPGIKYISHRRLEYLLWSDPCFLSPFTSWHFWSQILSSSDANCSKFPS